MLYSVDIGDHVWVGHRAIILGGMTQIRMSSIVGAMSFAKGNYPNNVCIEIPAKILHRNIAWSHDNCAEDIRSYNRYTNLTNI